MPAVQIANPFAKFFSAIRPFFFSSFCWKHDEIGNSTLKNKSPSNSTQLIICMALACSLFCTDITIKISQSCFKFKNIVAHDCAKESCKWHVSYEWNDLEGVVLEIIFFFQSFFFQLNNIDFSACVVLESIFFSSIFSFSTNWSRIQHQLDVTAF